MALLLARSQFHSLLLLLFWFSFSLYRCLDACIVPVYRCFSAHRIWLFVLLMLSHISVCTISFMWVYWPLASPYHRSLLRYACSCLFAQYLCILSLYEFCAQHTGTHAHYIDLHKRKVTQQPPNIGWFRCIKSIIVFSCTITSTKSETE